MVPLHVNFIATAMSESRITFPALAGMVIRVQSDVGDGRDKTQITSRAKLSRELTIRISQ